MELIVSAGERTERVRVERQGERYQVRIGEREFAVDSRALGPFVRSLVIDGAQFETAVFRLGEGRYLVGWDGRNARLEVVDPLTHLAEEAKGPGAGRGKQTVIAYMPGRVVGVAVREGDAVVAGQPLVVLEAMKMQNELQAERDAVVRKVHVAVGEAVEGGDPLIDLE